MSESKSGKQAYTLYLSAEKVQALREVAKKEDRSLSWMVEQGMNAMIERFVPKTG